MDNLLEYAIWIGLGFAVLLVFFITLTSLYRRASKEIAFVRTGVGGEKVVMNGGAVVFSCSLLHEALPVTKGVRYALLTFLRQPQPQQAQQRPKPALARR